MADTAVDELRRAYAAFSRGSLDESSRLCGNVLRRHARDAEALHLAAAIALRRGEPAVALEQVTAAIESAPHEARQYQTRGLILRTLRRPAEAESDFREALRLSPDFADAGASLGLSLFEKGEHEAAQRHLEAALRKRPEAAEWRYNLALCEVQTGALDAAQRNILEVLKARPDWPEALNTLGGIFAQRGELEHAAQAFQSALRAQPRLPQAWNNLGTVRASQGRFAQAQECFSRCLALAPSDAHAWSNLGNALRRSGDAQAAEHAYRQALTHAPGLASAWMNLGNLLREHARLGEAVAALERAVALAGAPEAHLSLAIALLSTGELERAWREYGWRHGAEPRSDGREALRAAIAARRPVELRGEQGYGDALFFLRWAPRLRAQPVELRFRGDARLFALLEKAALFARFDPETAPDSPGVHTIAIGDLPELLGDAGEPFPPPLALHADAGALEAASEVLRGAGPAPYVGVAWRAGMPSQAGEESLSKNIPVESLGAALRAMPGTVVSLQRRPLEGETAALAAALGRPVLDAAAFNDDLARMAGLAGALDHYVGVSSTNVHIAAGLGKAASILVPHPPEWRYGREGGATPWFPGFRVYREHPQRGWGEALAALAADLAEGASR